MQENNCKKDLFCTVLCVCDIASLRSELNHLHATAIEHLRQVHLKENNATKRELDDTIERCKEHVSIFESYKP